MLHRDGEEGQERHRWSDLIPRYLEGTLSGSERARLQEMLASDPELRDDLEETRALRTGLSIVDHVHEGHVESELLVAYARDARKVPRTERLAVEAHLNTCSDCRDELELTVRTLREAGAPSVARQSILTSVVDWLWTPSLQLRPAWGAAAAALLLIFGLSGSGWFGPGGSSPASFEISGQLQRGVRVVTELEISRAVPVAELHLIAPTIENRYYDLRLAAEDGTPILDFPNRKHAIPYVVLVPTRYLETGRYSVLLIETEAAATKRPRDSVEIPLSIRMNP